MAKKYMQGEFTPTNPEKYVGSYPIIGRSSWEFAVMRTADRHPNIIQWASEPLRIPYFNPIKNKQSVYVPDFLLVYEDRNGRRHQELIEVKPESQSRLDEKADRYTRMQAIINAHKWSAATKFCQRHGLKFRVVTQRDIFRNPR